MINDRIKSLQNRLIDENIDLYYFNTCDYHLSEYVSEHFKTIAYFSGFTGSLASLLVTKKDAFIFVDGRYHLQADQQCKKNGVKVIKLGTKGALEPLDFIAKNYPQAVVGLDGKRTSVGFAKLLYEKGLSAKSIDIYSDLIENRPPLTNNKIIELPIKYVGLSRKKKLQLIKHCLNGNCHIVNNLESIAYVLNLRSNDIEHTPVFLSYLVFLGNDTYLFCDVDRFDENLKNKLYDDDIIIRPYDAYYDFLKHISNEDVILDENKVNFESFLAVNDRKNRIFNKRSFIEDMKSIKNNVEQENSKLAHIYDGVAMLRFLMWIDSIDKKRLTEYDVSKKIDEFRLGYKAIDLSFNSIVAYNQNAAIVHYSAPEKGSTRLNNKGILLLDTGGHYMEGTTDITRTIALGPVDEEVKKYFTIVLKSMFNLSETVFLSGINGNQLDAIARKDLWANNVNYLHGTGHGVGHILSVHEGPPNIRYMHTENGSEMIPFKPGMIVSDEPGVYFEGKFGIRCENLLLCKKVTENEFGEFLKFETLTLVPFDLRLINKKYLDAATIDAINKYHNRVYSTLLPYLDEKEEKFLRKLTKRL